MPTQTTVTHATRSRSVPALTDERSIDVIRRAGAAVAPPPAAPPSSFALHAALEVGARVDLLGRATPEGRGPILDRLEAVAATYRSLATVPAPTGRRPPGRPVDALAVAVAEGDVDAADAAAVALDRADALALADLVLPSLAAAGHGTIALDRVRRTDADDLVGLAGIRLLARQLAEHPTWRLTWHVALRAGDRDGRGAPGPSNPSDGMSALVAALLDPPAPGPRGDGFIYPTLHLVESSGQAASLLAGPLAAIGNDPEAVDDAGRHLLRVAAWSMLQDDPASAPYGWSHCLTLPLASLGLVGSVEHPGDALAVAATYVLAFRSTQGEVRLDPTHVPAAGTAAGEAWRAPPHQRPALAAHLAAHAGAHPDAHLAKYVDACWRAGALDPAAGRLYLAAAAHLAEIWEAGPAAT